MTEGLKRGTSMGTTIFHERVLTIIACTILLAFLALSGALCQFKGTDTDTPSTYNQRGVDFFKKGFYEHAPKNQAAIPCCCGKTADKPQMIL
jgi:hypothetical protein